MSQVNQAVRTVSAEAVKTIGIQVGRAQHKMAAAETRIRRTAVQAYRKTTNVVAGGAGWKNLAAGVASKETLAGLGRGVVNTSIGITNGLIGFGEAAINSAIRGPLTAMGPMGTLTGSMLPIPDVRFGRIDPYYEDEGSLMSYAIGTSVGEVAPGVVGPAVASRVGQFATNAATRFGNASRVGAVPSRGILKTPTVSSTKLQNIVNNLYKGTTNPNRIGSGTTMDAARYEGSHITKAEESVQGLQNWLKNNPNAPYHDRLVGQSILDELLDSLGRPQ